jgi:GT2 family glycosyltransferase
VVVVHYGDVDDTRECLQSLARLTYRNHVVVVVHNGTGPASIELASAFAEHRHVHLATNGGYAAGVNAGARMAVGLGADYVYALNNDVELDSGALEKLVDTCESDRSIGVAGGVHYYKDRPGVIQNSGSYIDWVTGRVRTKADGLAEESAIPALEEPDFICGAGFFFPVRVLGQIGGLEERYFLYCEESDWCFRVRAAGLRVVRVSGSRLFHWGGRAVARTPGLYQYFATRNKLWLARRWAPRGRLAGFLLFHVLYQYPKMLLGRLVRRDWRGLSATVRGIRDGFLL